MSAEHGLTREQLRAGQEAHRASGTPMSLALWLAAHDAEVRAGVVAEEPGWEYGVHCESSGRVNSVGAPWMDRKFAEKVTANDSGNYGVCRRKAGPWVPVKQEGADDV